MSEIILKCINHVMTTVNTPDITAGAVEYDTVRFEFCPNWNGYTKTAVFYRSEDEVYYQMLDSENRCTIPKEVLQSKGKIRIGVFGVMSNKTLTSSVVTYNVLEGAITENLTSSDPTPDIYAQLVSKYNDLVVEIDVERKRIDEIVSGGTADANAELIDIRVDVKGQTHNSAGSAVRNQVNTLSSDIEEINNVLPKEYIKENTTIENGVWNNQHQIKIIESGEYLHLTEVIVKGGDILKVTCWGNKWYSPFYIFDANYTLLGSYHTISGDTSETDIHVVNYEVTMPEGAKYFCGNAFYNSSGGNAEIYRYDIANISNIKTNVSYLETNGLKRILVNNASAESDYLRLLSNLPINSFIAFHSGWFIDTADLPSAWYTAITLPNTQNEGALSQRTQLVISGVHGGGTSLADYYVMCFRNIVGDKVSEWNYIHYGINNGKYFAFGDSVCRGNRPDASKSPYSWVEAFGKLHNLDTYNCAIGGQGYLTTRYTVKALDTIKATDITNASLITLSFAINDASDTVEIGSYTDTSENTVMGQVYNCISYIYSQTKKCQVIVCGSTPQSGSRNERLETINTQLKQFCEYYGIAFIDLHDCPINAFNGHDTIITGDGTHFTDEGYKLLGQFMCGKLSALYGYK